MENNIEHEKMKSFKSYFIACNGQLKNTSYLQQRGISLETANRYMIGYDENYQTFEIDKKGQTCGATWQALIIPTSEYSYIARNTHEVAENPKENRIRKEGPANIFNQNAIYTSNKPIFITEGEIDALSIIDAGGVAIGLGGVQNYSKLLKLIDNRRPIQPFFIALDNDTAGFEGMQALQLEFDQRFINHLEFNVYGAYKDANEYITSNRQEFIKKLRNAEELTLSLDKGLNDSQKTIYLKNSAYSHIRDFLNGISNSVNTQVISTGFRGLDNALGGGLYEGLYVIGAISSLGKTTLMMQIIDQLSKMGEDCLIFSLEMARSELMAKSISRETLSYVQSKKLDTKYAKTARGITTGKRYTKYNNTDKDVITSAITAYEAYAKHVFIHEGTGDIGIDEIRKTVSKHIEITGNNPIVLVDYLQILAPYNEKMTDKQNTDKAVLEMKRLSRDYKIPIICISSFNRESYRTGSNGRYGKVSIADFKESGAIEYSADVLIGLEFKGAGDKAFDEKKAKREIPREIRLVIMKNRNGSAWEENYFKYYPQFNYFEETIEEE